MTKTASKKEKYTNLSDTKINSIVSVLKGFKYTDSEYKDRICPYLAQWLYSQGVAIESTCLIISEVINPDPIQNQLDEIYKGEFPPIAKSTLSEFLTAAEYNTLEKLIEARELSTVTGEIDDNTNIITNFKIKQVIKEKTKHYSTGKVDTTLIPVIEAVPTAVIVYDSPITDAGRTFRTTWSSKHSKRNFTIAGENGGATIPEMSDYIRSAGFTYAPRELDVVISCMINSLIDTGFADIKTDIDNRGIYFDRATEKLIPVKLEFSEVTDEEILSAIDILNELHEHFKSNEDTLGSVLKWGIMSIFSYAMKQGGNWLPYLYLKGAAGSGKTTLAQISTYLYDKPSSDNTLGGSSFNTEYRIGLNLSKECNLRIVNEPANVFGKDSTRELVKVCVESKTCRKVQGKVYPAFSPVIFTANQYLPDDDALQRRMYILNFTHNQRKTNNEKKEFKNKFHVNTPTMSNLVSLQAIGRFAIRLMLSDPSHLFEDWQKTADFIVTKFYDRVGVKVPVWLLGWAESETLDDYDIGQRELIRNFFVVELNTARRKITFKDDNGYITNPHNTVGDGSLQDVVWSMINERLFSWAIPHVKRDGSENVCLTQSFKTMLNSEIGYSNNLQSLAELLQWECHNVNFNGNRMRVIEVSIEDFMAFVYPSAGDGVDEWF